jgi:ketosteroid isomerase-like protein
MKTLVRAGAGLAALAALAFAPAAAQEKQAPQGDPMASWKPPRVKAEKRDREEIQALFAKMEGASRKGDLEAAAALVDFPVLMVTDDSKGEALGSAWTREQWLETMKPFYKPMPDVKITHRADIFVITDSLASADDRWSMTTGGKTLAGRSSTLVIRKGGAWKIKAMTEGGWGDLPMAAPAQGASGSGKQ